MIRKFKNVHTCFIDFYHNAHRPTTSSVIVKHILGKLDNPCLSYYSIAIARVMEHKFGVKISYSKLNLKDSWCDGLRSKRTVIH